ncbi:hypothetical protein LOZ66_000945 [Ophidiomyces ophidiicola]|nr:hypothetical protein LOZ66_000945 [Ophidiomyces ophidiicola]
MPVGINQPSNQIKFTNVSIVRLKKGKKRFELACYKNKLLEYRSGAETDLDNVLQIPTVFLSVSKAQTAPAADLAAAFGPSAPRAAIVQEILRRGELQVGERERRDLLERVEKEVVARVAAQLVDPVERRVYTPGMIAKALDQLKAAPAPPLPPPSSSEQEEDQTKKKKKKMPAWTGVVAGRPAKTQALDAMRALIAHQPIAVMRARMRLRVTCATAVAKRGAAGVRSPQSMVSEGQDTNTNSSSSNSTGKGASRAKAKKGKKAQQVDEEDQQQRTVATTTQEGQAVAAAAATVKDRILGFFEQVETQQLLDGGEEWEVVGFAEPGAVKGLSDFVGGETKGRGRVEVLDMAVTHDDDDDEEEEGG